VGWSTGKTTGTDSGLKKGKKRATCVCLAVCFPGLDGRTGTKRQGAQEGSVDDNETPNDGGVTYRMPNRNIPGWAAIAHVTKEKPGDESEHCPAGQGRQVKKRVDLRAS